MFRTLLPLFYFIGLIQAGCGDANNSMPPGEGYITYQIEYLNADSLQGMEAMLPEEMILYFKENKTCTEIKLGGGLFETRMISDGVNLTMNTLVQALGQKSVLKLNKQDVDLNYSDRIPLKLSVTNNTKSIAGYSCSEILVEDSTGNSFNVYFTKELNVVNPNWSTPFRDIDGILLDYSLSFNGMIMHLIAKEITFKAVDSSLFVVPDNYTIIHKNKS